MSLILFFDKLNKVSLFLLLFLIPLFFLPFAQNILDFPKQILASILIFLSLIGWLGKRAGEGKIEIKYEKTFFLVLFLIFLSSFLSLVFSLSLKVSFWGYHLDVVDGFLTLFLFLILVFLVVNSFKEKSELFLAIFFLLLSGGILGIINLFQLYNIFLLPFEFTKFSSFNTVGTTNSLALLCSVLLPLSLVLSFRGKGSFKIIFGIISFILFANILLINFKTAWISLIVGILILFVFGLRDKKGEIRIGFASALMIGLIFSIFFYFFPVLLPGFPLLPPEVSLGLGPEAYILKESFGQGGLKNIVLGSGPGTFVFNYSQYRPFELNQTLFWGTRFLRGNSTFFDWVLTKGFFGGISLIFLYFFIVYFLFKNLRKDEEKETFFEIKLGLAAGILGLIFTSFFYSFNFVLFFVFWFFLGGLLFCFGLKSIKTELSYSKVFVVNFALIFIIILGLGLSFFQGQRYLAEAKYLKGIEVSQVGDFNRAIDYFQEAINLDSSSDVYWRDLSQLYLAKTNLISEDESLSFEERRRLTNLAIIEGAEAINEAIRIMPINVANWNVRGFFYRSLIGIEGAAELALASYQKASELEPASPFAFGEKGRVYILMAQNFAERKEENFRQESLNLALNSLKKAIELKPDYAPAHYLLAIAYDQKGNLNEAILSLERARMITPQDSGIAFQLGLLYWRAEKLNEAKEEFQRALGIASDYADARYMLGLVFDRQGEKEKAKEEFEKVAELNPQSQEIKKILENIEKGLPAFEGISDLDYPSGQEDFPLQPSFEEVPPEISPL